MVIILKHCILKMFTTIQAAVIGHKDEKISHDFQENIKNFEK